MYTGEVAPKDNKSLLLLRLPRFAVSSEVEKRLGSVLVHRMYMFHCISVGCSSRLNYILRLLCSYLGCCYSMLLDIPAMPGQ